MTLKVGDKVVKYSFVLREPRDPIAILTVVRVGKRRAVLSNNDWAFIGAEPANPEELARCEQIIADRLEKRLEAQRKQQEREADPCWQIASKLPNYDIEDWMRLDLSTLQDIQKWLVNTKRHAKQQKATP